MDAFEEQVQQQIDRLTNKSLREIEQAVNEKRLNWWANHGDLKPGGPVTPRLAFERLFFDYMGLKKDDLPILSESDTEITWASKNPCPTLEACGRLNLDTRKVCRQAYEKSTQAFISQLDPCLRFVRSYKEIRPHAKICRESIICIDLEGCMRMAIEEAEASRKEGNKGYGAVIWYAGKVIARAHDTAGTKKDPSLHAEVNAIREACRVLKDGNLCGAVLVSTCEPCPMCSSLAVWANVSAIAYGASIKETVALGKSRILVTVEEIVNRSPVQMEILPGVLREECIRYYLD
jgi:tRNA(Arg) A34 adenosine deaminase TadA